MSGTIVAPMTQSELTETDINYSVKIGKQVLTQQIKTRLDVLYKEINDLCNLIPPVDKNFKLYQSLIEKQFEMSFNNDSDLAALRAVLKLFTNNNMKKNTDLVIDTNIGSICNNLLRPFNTYTPGKDGKFSVYLSQYVKEALKKQNISIRYSLCVSLPSKEIVKDLKNGSMDIDSQDAIENSFELKLYLDSKIEEILLAQVKIFDRIEPKVKEHNSLVDRLNNIDKYMEQLEANLLVKELQRSEHGKTVLAATSDLINSVMINETELLRLE